MTLDDLVKELRAVFGTGLRAVVVYGPAATGTEAIARHELHTLVLVDALPLDHLEEGGAHIDAWVRAGHPPPLVLTGTEWQASADIFPEEYAEILEAHRVLHGALPTDGMQVKPAELRLAVERDAMGKLLQVRRAVLAAGADSGRRVELLAASFGAVLEAFRGTLRVHGARPPADAGETVRDVAARAGLDAAPFLRVQDHRRGERKILAGEAHDVLAGYLDGLERLVRHLDAVQPAARSAP